MTISPELIEFMNLFIVYQELERNSSIIAGITQKIVEIGMGKDQYSNQSGTGADIKVLAQFDDASAKYKKELKSYVNETQKIASKLSSLGIKSQLIHSILNPDGELAKIIPELEISPDTEEEEHSPNLTLIPFDMNGESKASDS